MRTLLLTERRPSECHLPEEAVAFLQEHHAAHLRLAPARGGRVVLTPTRLVGLIVAPGVRLVVRPKLPLQSFAQLLDPEGQPMTADAGAEFDLLAFMAMRLAQLIEERLRAGLQRGYAEQHSAGPVVQGRLDLPATLRESPRRDRLHSSRDELTTDILCNRLLRATVESLLRLPSLGAVERARLTATLGGLQDIAAIVPTAEDFARASPPEYGRVLELCRLIVAGLQPGVGTGRPGEGFLIDLERLFERLVGGGIRAAFAAHPFRVEEQRSFALGDTDVSIRPDVIVRTETEIALIVDAKWKILRPGHAQPTDLYQVLAYGSVLGARRLALVYPGRRDDMQTLRFGAGMCVALCTLRVTTGPNGMRRSLHRLGRLLRATAFLA